MSFILRMSIFLFPFKFVVDIRSDVSFDSDNDKEESAEACPAYESAIIAEVKISVGNSTSLSEGEDKPPEDIDEFERVDSISNFL